MKEARARIEGVDASWKDLGAVADLIRYKMAKDAVELLEKAAKDEIFVPYRRHNKKMGHRKHGVKGRYPMKEAKIMLKLLKSAIANARVKGLDESKLKIVHVAANKKQIFYRIQPKGRPMRHRYVTARAEIILGETDGA
ncbi:MAG: 50S ribosomal protein L22 [Candidatus Micrarchaeota archaeon]|nr:50S ribosomal protein L22 [Candidatus Micrarchaeota archaeon]